MTDFVGFAERLLRELDLQVADLDAKIVSGTLPDHEAYRGMVGRRQGLLAARRLVVEGLSEEQRRFLGLMAD